MALSTYSELQASILSWIRRDDLSTQTADFITLCETELLAPLLRLRVMETEVTLTATPGSRFIALPTGYIDCIAAWDSSLEPRQSLTIKLPQELPVVTTAHAPRYIAIDGANVAFECPADAARTIAFRFFKSFSLSDAEPTNWLLTNHPGLYLYGSLIQARAYARNPGDVAFWEDQFAKALERVQQKESRSRSRAVMATEAGRLSGRHFDINRGY